LVHIPFSYSHRSTALADLNPGVLEFMLRANILVVSPAQTSDAQHQFLYDLPASSTVASAIEHLVTVHRLRTRIQRY
jgi:hypothetical protein